MKQCNRCKINKDQKDFLKNKKELVTCSDCREKKRLYQNKNKCEHNRYKSQCIDCEGGSICVHKKRKSICKDCDGSSICEHKIQKFICYECNGASICEHMKRKTLCKECKGSQICIHNKIKYQCVECNGGNICIHKKRRTMCYECNGASICEHKKRKSQCKDCKGSQICVHNKNKHYCRKCNGSQICSHKKIKNKCRICNPLGHLAHIVSSRIRHSLVKNKNLTSIKYLECDLKTYRSYLENKFLEGMSWDNFGDWHIDHIIPLKYNNPTIEQVIKRLHYTNTQPLWKIDNLRKGNRYIL
jgi:hypothetical protein